MSPTASGRADCPQQLCHNGACRNADLTTLLSPDVRWLWEQIAQRADQRGDAAMDSRTITITPPDASAQHAAVIGLPAPRPLPAGRTHSIASLYEAFEPEEAFALAQRLEIHHTPKHGSWLNIAEIELSALTRQCLDRRIEDLDTLNTELSAWQNATNTDQRQVNWQFTTHDARIKLRHLYPRN